MIINTSELNKPLRMTCPSGRLIEVRLDEFGVNVDVISGGDVVENGFKFYKEMGAKI